MVERGGDGQCSWEGGGTVRDWRNCNGSDCMKLSIKQVRRVGGMYRMARAMFDWSRNNKTTQSEENVLPGLYCRVTIPHLERDTSD